MSSETSALGVRLTLKIAEEFEIKSIQLFFKIYLDSDTDGIVNEEFLCPFGVSSAIKRKQMVVLKEGVRILGALRFYPRKSNNGVSIYQFALNERIRGKGILKKLLEKTGYKNFDLTCFVDSNFNEYYKKTGWILEKSDKKLNYWKIKI